MLEAGEFDKCLHTVCGFTRYGYVYILKNIVCIIVFYIKTIFVTFAMNINNNNTERYEYKKNYHFGMCLGGNVHYHGHGAGRGRRGADVPKARTQSAAAIAREAGCAADTPYGLAARPHGEAI